MMIERAEGVRCIIHPLFEEERIWDGLVKDGEKAR
jgi:hypothetical protein